MKYGKFITKKEHKKIHKLQITKIYDEFGNPVFAICSCGRLRLLKKEIVK